MTAWNEEDNVWKAVSAIHRVDSRESEIAPLDDALVALRQELQCDASHQLKPSKTSAQAIQSAVVRSLLGSTPKAEACIALLSKTGQFDEKELRRLRRIRFFVEEPSGRISINKKTISPCTATLLLCLLCVFSGIWIGWIIFGSKGDIQGITNSFALGTIVGSIVSLILDKSFRFHQIRSKVTVAAPWLLE